MAKYAVVARGMIFVEAENEAEARRKTLEMLRPHVKVCGAGWCEAEQRLVPSCGRTCLRAGIEIKTCAGCPHFRREIPRGAWKEEVMPPLSLW